MGCRGVLFALSADDESRVLDAAGDDEALIELIQEEIEEAWDEPHLCELDKAWEAIHRCLDGGRLRIGAGRGTALAILGGRPLYGGEDYIITILDAGQVRDTSAALEGISEGEIRARYAALPAEYDFKSDEDLAYTLEYFEAMKSFYRRAAAEGRAVMFTVDQ